MFQHPVVTPFAANNCCDTPSALFLKKGLNQICVLLQTPAQSSPKEGMPAICQVVMGHRSEELRAAGVPYQSYVEQAEVALLQKLFTPPVTIVLGPTASYGNDAFI